VNPVQARQCSCIRLLERFAGARSHPAQACATITLLASIRQDVLQLIRLRALPGGLRTCDERASVKASDGRKRP
jgi:hypothetical protein